jgi:predicted kinase
MPHFTKMISGKYLWMTLKKVMAFFYRTKAEESLTRERLKKPRMDSDADFEFYKEIKKQWEPLNEHHLIL